MMNRGKATIVDVRDATNLPPATCATQKTFRWQTWAIASASWTSSKSKTVIVVCQSGARADKAVRQLAKRPVSRTSRLDGGMPPGRLPACR
jgi:rhodanese-related sulfurtransferase